MTSVPASERAGAVYRADVDGLRAVAVLAVVAHHAWPGLLAGGFYGVDVFFVISGFLITGILMRERAGGPRALLAFYARRVRRILPAMTVMLATVTAAALILMTPQDLALFGRSMASVGALSSNRFFLSMTGYFAPEAAQQPLLHTWSLSIEEQFYLIWPAAVLALFHPRLRPWAPWVIALVMLASFLEMTRLSVLSGINEAFYYLRSRLWELLLGALVAVVPITRVPQRWRGPLGAFGAAALAVGFSPLGGDRALPGMAASAACAGAALIIAAQGAGVVGRALAIRPAVVVGRISYSLYLWHWPLLSVPALVLSRHLAPMEATVAVGAALTLAWASWRWVEQPVRRGSRSGAGMTIGIGVAALAAIWAVGAGFSATGGLPARAAPGVMEAQAASTSQPPTNAACHMPDGSAPPPTAACTSGPGPARVVLWGDSHAGHLAPALWRVGGDAGLSVRQASRSSCPPIPLSGTGEACADFDEAMAAQLADVRPDAVILAARWVEYFRRNGGDPALFRREVRAGLTALRSRLGPDVVLIVWGPTPEFDAPPTLCWARAAQARVDPSACDRMRPRDRALAREVERVLREEADAAGARWISPYEALCPAATCVTVDGRRFFYRDADHLSGAGADRTAPLLRQALSDLPGSGAARKQPE